MCKSLFDAAGVSLLVHPCRNVWWEFQYLYFGAEIGGGSFNTCILVPKCVVGVPILVYQRQNT
ncbi:MAG: hypothetical protein WCG93_16225 [Paludibacter sp.]